jgi:hypothetical protein
MTKEELIQLIENDEDVQRAIKNALDQENYREDTLEASAWV